MLTWHILALIDWCLKLTLAVFQLYRGAVLTLPLAKWTFNCNYKNYWIHDNIIGIEILNVTVHYTLWNLQRKFVRPNKKICVFTVICQKNLGSTKPEIVVSGSGIRFQYFIFEISGKPSFVEAVLWRVKQFFYLIYLCLKTHVTCRIPTTCCIFNPLHIVYNLSNLV